MRILGLCLVVLGLASPSAADPFLSTLPATISGSFSGGWWIGGFDLGAHPSAGADGLTRYAAAQQFTALREYADTTFTVGLRATAGVTHPLSLTFSLVTDLLTQPTTLASQTVQVTRYDYSLIDVIFSERSLHDGQTYWLVATSTEQTIAGGALPLWVSSQDAFYYSPIATQHNGGSWVTDQQTMDFAISGRVIGDSVVNGDYVALLQPIRALPPVQPIVNGVPEPSSLLLVTLGLLVVRRRPPPAVRNVNTFAGCSARSTQTAS